MEATFTKDVRNWDLPGNKVVGSKASNVLYKKGKRVEILCRQGDKNVVIMHGPSDKPVVNIIPFSMLHLEGDVQDIVQLEDCSSEYEARPNRVYLGNSEYVPMGTHVRAVHFYEDFKKAVVLIPGDVIRVKHVYTDDIYSPYYSYE